MCNWNNIENRMPKIERPCLLHVIDKHGNKTFIIGCWVPWAPFRHPMSTFHGYEDVYSFLEAFYYCDENGTIGNKILKRVISWKDAKD